jgi:hypothetical protein
MKYTLFLFLLIACEPKKEKPKPTVKGKWEYERIELYSGEKFDLQDTAYNRLHGMHAGLTLSFSGNSTFRVTQKKDNQPEEFIGQQNYEIPPGDSILRLKNAERPDDNFPIVELTDSLFKLNLFNSPEGYIVFKRKE